MLASLPPYLSAVLKDPERLTFGEDEYSGAGVKPGRWEPPEEISADTVNIARAAIEDYTAKQAPAPLTVVVQWLGSLINGIPHGMAENALGLRIGALAEAVEDYPAWVWTKDTRKLARARFDYVPAAKELIEFAEEITAGPRSNAAKLMRILDIGERRRQRKMEPGESPRQASGWGWSDPAEMEAQRQYLREKQDRERKELAAIVRKQDQEAGAAPALERFPLETDKDFVARVVAAVRAFLDRATEVMKNPRHGRGRGDRGGAVPLSKVAETLKGGNKPPRPDIAERAAVPEPVMGGIDDGPPDCIIDPEASP